MSTKSSSNQQKRAKKKRQKELKRRKKKQTQASKNAGRSDWYERPLRSNVPQTALTMSGVQNIANATRSGLGFDSILESLELGRKDQSLSSASLDKPIEQAVAEKWWNDYKESDGVGRLAMTRKKLALLPFERQEDYFPEAVFELETKLSADQYVGFLVEIEQQQPELFAEHLKWFASSMIFFYLNQGESERLEHVVTVMAEKQQEVSESFFSIFSALRLAGQDQMASRLLHSAVDCLPNCELMHWAVEEIYNWVWLDLLCNWLEQGSEPKHLDEILNRFPESLIGEEENQDQHQEILEFYRDLGLRMAGQKQTEWQRENLINSAEDKQWGQLRMLSGQWMNWLINQQKLSPNTACEFRDLLFSATSKLAEKANRKPCQVLLNDLNPSHFDEVLATSFQFMSLAQFEAPATIVAFRYLYDYFLELGLIKKNVHDKAFATLDKLEKDVNRILDGNFGFLPRYQNHTMEATTEHIA